MTNPPDYAYLLIGAFIAAFTQFLRMITRAEKTSWRIILGSSGVAWVASFSLCGLLIWVLKVTLGIDIPPLIPMYLGGVLGWLGGERVFNVMIGWASRKYDVPELLEDEK
jgi:hypothetical protein